METIYIFVSASIGALIGWFTAVIMMGAKISEANDIIYQKEVERRMELAKLVEDAKKPSQPRKTTKKQTNSNQSRQKSQANGLDKK